MGKSTGRYKSRPDNSTTVDNKKGKKIRKRKKSKFVLFFKVVFIAIMLVSFISVGLFAGYIYGCINTAEPITDAMLDISGNQSTIVYDSNKRQLSVISSAEMRQVVPLKKIPKWVQDAFIAIEDERFWEHNGFDLYGFIRAAVKKITEPGNREGASTITMQLVKNLTKNDSVTLQRKFQEQYLAMNLETRITKEDILKLYLNLINFNGVYGVQAASMKYFGKGVDKIDIAEGACLAAIIKAPSTYGPTSKEGIKKNLERQKLVLDSMLRNNLITQTQYTKAYKEKIKFRTANRSTTHTTTNTNKTYRTFFVDDVLKEVKADLIKSGYSEDGAVSAIYGGGLKIYTTMDSAIQSQMDKVFNDESFFPNPALNGKKVQASMVIIDPSNGQVKAMYGTHGKKAGDFVLNRASAVERQPGSSIKPIAVYGPALDKRIITMGTIIDDAPSYMQGGSKVYPRNAGGGYRGFTPIWQAIQSSINVVAAKVYQLEGGENALDYLSRVGIDRTQMGIALSLGGMEQGVSPLQMAAAYVPFVHKGIYFEPTTYSKVIDSKGRVILDKKIDLDVKQRTENVYQEGTAYIMERMMQRVVTNGTAYPYGIIQNGRIDSAGKTGTTNETKDKWFIGYTPYYVGATWYGYDIATSMPEMAQALRIWKAVMDPIHSKLPSARFVEPAGLIHKTVCSYSGMLPSSACSGDPYYRLQTNLYLPGTVPTEYCTYHAVARVHSSPVNGVWQLSSSGIYKTFVTKRSSYSGAWSLPSYPYSTYTEPVKPKPPTPSSVPMPIG